MKQATAGMESQSLAATNTSLLAGIDVLRSAFGGLGASIFLADRDLDLIVAKVSQ